MNAAAELASHPLLLTHVLAAALSLTLAPVNLIRRRRDRVHRRIGRTWFAAMVVTALTSFGIQEPFLAFSWLHALALWTMLSLVLGVVAIRRGNRPAHIGHMIGCYLGLWVAFVWAAAVPQRTVAQVIDQTPLTAAVTGLLAVLTAVGLYWVFRTVPTTPARRAAAGVGGRVAVPASVDLPVPGLTVPAATTTEKPRSG